MSNYVFVNVLTAEAVRSVCVEHNYYTRGSNDDYENMFEMCGYVTPDTLEAIATDIYNHSYTEDAVLDIMKTLSAHIHTNLCNNSRANGNRVTTCVPTYYKTGRRTAHK